MQAYLVVALLTVLCRGTYGSIRYQPLLLQCGIDDFHTMVDTTIPSTRATLNIICLAKQMAY